MSDYRPKVAIEYDHTDAVSDEIKTAIRRVIRTASFAVEASAKVNAPVDTGALKNSINTVFENGGERGIVSTPTEYAAYVEYGTRYQTAQPYMLPAYNRVKRKVNTLIKNEISRIERGMS